MVHLTNWAFVPIVALGFSLKHYNGGIQMNTYYPLIPKSAKEIPIQMVYPCVDLSPRPKAFKGMLSIGEITEIARRVWGDEK